MRSGALIFSEGALTSACESACESESAKELGKYISLCNPLGKNLRGWRRVVATSRREIPALAQESLFRSRDALSSGRSSASLILSSSLSRLHVATSWAYVPRLGRVLQSQAAQFVSHFRRPPCTTPWRSRLTLSATTRVTRLGDARTAGGFSFVINTRGDIACSRFEVHEYRNRH